MRDLLIGMLIRIAGVLLKELLKDGLEIIQQIEEDPSILNKSTRNLRLFNRLKDKYPNQEKIIPFVIELLEIVESSKVDKEVKSYFEDKK